MIDKSEALLNSAKALADQVERLHNCGVSQETINEIINVHLKHIEDLDLAEKVNGFEDYLKKCSTVYSSMDHYTGDYAFAVNDVLKWYKKWFNIER